MIIPNDEECRRVLGELEGDPQLSQWQSDFIDSNRWRVHFSDRQKEIIAEMMQQFEV